MLLCDNSDKEKKEMIELRNITICFRLWYFFNTNDCVQIRKVTK
jgi:hypothetical protein